MKNITKEHKDVAVALDARKDCAYLYIDGDIKGAVPLDDVENLLKEKEYSLITDDKLLPRLGGISYQQKEYHLGDVLAKITYQKLQSGNCNWKDVKPLYIQPPPEV